MTADGQEASGKQLPNEWGSLVCSSLPAQLHSQQTSLLPPPRYNQTAHGDGESLAARPPSPPTHTVLPSSSRRPGPLPFTSSQHRHEPSQPGDHHRATQKRAVCLSAGSPCGPGWLGNVLPSYGPSGLRQKPHSRLPTHSKRAAMAKSGLGAPAATSAAHRPRAHRAGHTADRCALAIQRPPNSWTGAPHLTRPWVPIPRSCIWA